MEIIFTIVVVLFIAVYLIAQDSKKETKREQYGEAVGYLAHSAAETIAGVAHDIAEPSEKKKIRKAREALASRNGSLYRFEFFSRKDYLKRLLTVDDHFKQSLDILGLSEDRWKKIGLHLFYVGCIRIMSRENTDYAKKNSESFRRNIIEKWEKEGFLTEYAETLKEALTYFHISEEDWIKFGDTVIEMYNINDDRDIEEYGIITQIMPMKNNKHLL